MARTNQARRLASAPPIQNEPTSVFATSLYAEDGGRVDKVGSALEFRDAEGRLLVRYHNGALEVAPVSGDLKLRAPAGRVEIESSMDVLIRAQRDIMMAAARSAEMGVDPASTTRESDDEGKKEDPLRSRMRVDLAGSKLVGHAVEVRAQKLNGIVAKADLVATAIRTSALTVETTARKVETTAEKVSLKTKELTHEIAGAFQSKIGRVRSIVKGAFSMQTKTVNMKSEEDTSIDGRRVLLG